MGIPSEMRNTWLNKRRESLWITSPVEEEKIRRSRECTRGWNPKGKKNPFLFFFWVFFLAFWEADEEKKLSLVLSFAF